MQVRIMEEIANHVKMLQLPLKRFQDLRAARKVSLKSRGDPSLISEHLQLYPLHQQRGTWFTVDLRHPNRLVIPRFYDRGINVAEGGLKTDSLLS